jgi:hypothetical protein
LAGGTEENEQNLSQNNWCPSHNTNWAPHKYTAEVLLVLLPETTCLVGDKKQYKRPVSKPGGKDTTIDRDTNARYQNKNLKERCHVG